MKALQLLEQHVGSSVSVDLGPEFQKTDIQSAVGPFTVLPDYQIMYPGSVIKALAKLYREYNSAFTHLVEKNREWPTDYQYCMFGPNGSPVNFGVQIDMIGLPDGFLKDAVSMTPEEVCEALRMRIFEIENSLAMYQLLEQVCSQQNGEITFFKYRFRQSLNELRTRFGMPIALLAVTQKKYNAMLSSEFGKSQEENITDKEVRQLSGFDKFFGPSQFKAYLDENGGQCGYLLYARTSDPVAKLKNPEVEVEHPLLSNPKIRQIIKAHALTFNVDAPEMEPSRRINDTKEYMPPIGMGYPIFSDMDIFSPEFAAHLKRGKKYEDFNGNRLNPLFSAFLKQQKIDVGKVALGELELRAKPLKGVYGCYGHLSGSLAERKFRNELRRYMRQRSSGYLIQPEFAIPVIENSTDGRRFTYIDRNFLALTNGQVRFLGGFRSLMPVESQEAKMGRNHGNGSTVWAEIISTT